MKQQNQRGISLVMVAAIMAALGLALMAALMSMRQERNFFKEGWDKLAGAVPSPTAALAPAAPPPVMKKCVVGGRTVISNTECRDDNKTSRTIEIHDTRGFEAPKAPVQEQAAPTSDPALDKVIEKQLH